MHTNDLWYIEAEPGVRFVRAGGTAEDEEFLLWDGYFGPIMEAMHHLHINGGSRYIRLLEMWNEDAWPGFDSERLEISELHEVLNALQIDIVWRGKVTYLDDVRKALSALRRFIETASVNSQQVSACLW